MIIYTKTFQRVDWLKTHKLTQNRVQECDTVQKVEIVELIANEMRALDSANSCRNFSVVV